VKVVNKTKWDTKYLKKLFLECEKHIFNTYLVHGEAKKDRHVTVKTHRTYWVGGYAWYHSHSIVIKIPPPVSVHLGNIKTENAFSARRVAQVYLHEVGHNIGLMHKQMVPSSKIDVSWWPDENIPLKITKEKPKVNLIEVRAAKAQKKLDEWTKKLNRAKTFVKKYQGKVRYYEKKAVAHRNGESE